MKKWIILSICLILCIGIKLVGKDKHKKYADNKTYVVPLPAFVADYFDKMPVLTHNALTREGVALGRKLFYETKLSRNNSISCGSCHQQRYAFSDNRKFSLGVDDSVGIINSMPLFNLGWTKKFFWDGRARSLEEQMQEPIVQHREMANNWDVILQRLNADKKYKQQFKQIFGLNIIDSYMVMKAIAQFEIALVSFNTKFDQYYFEGQADALSPQEERGLDIFFGFGGCNHCHSDVLLTDNFFRNNGLDQNPEPGLFRTTGKEKDRGRLKVPSLRNIALTAPYMHDGRFSTLEEVLDFYSRGIQQKSPNIDEHIIPFGKGLQLTDAQKADLIAFLHTLTDSSFIRNPDFSDPNQVK